MTDARSDDAPPTCYRHPDRATYISCQRCGRPICPDCQTQAAVGVQCPECVRQGHAAAPAAGGPAVRAARAFRPGRAVVTFTLMGLIVVTYALQWLTGQALTAAWVLNPSVVGAEPWRLLTSTLLHSPASMLHILFNLYALFIFGPALETFLGRVRFLALYVVAGLGGSLGVLAIYELAIVTDGASIVATNGFLMPASALGASGAIFGLMGAYLPLRRAIGINITQLLIVLGINVAIGFLASGIAWEAHLGGLAVGALVGTILMRNRRPELKRRRTLLIAGVAAGLLAVFAVFVASAPSFYGL